MVSLALPPLKLCGKCGTLKRLSPKSGQWQCWVCARMRMRARYRALANTPEQIAYLEKRQGVVCRKHGIEKEADGYRFFCRACSLEYSRKYRERDRGVRRPSTRIYNVRYYSQNKVRLRAKNREYARANRDRLNAQARDRHRQIRYEVLSYYSQGTLRCACCEIADYEFLTIDHANGDGAKHRRETPTVRTALAAWLRRNGFPEGFQVLCLNCNFARGHFGRCPCQKDAVNNKIATDSEENFYIVED